MDGVVPFLENILDGLKGIDTGLECHPLATTQENLLMGIFAPPFLTFKLKVICAASPLVTAMRGVAKNNSVNIVLPIHEKRYYNIVP